MAKVEDYISGKILKDAEAALRAIKSVELPLIGSYVGKKLLEMIEKFDPMQITVDEASELREFKHEDLEAVKRLIYKTIEISYSDIYPEEAIEYFLDLSASIVSKRFYDSLGYVTQKEDYIPVRNNQKLIYYEMAKKKD